MPPRRLGQRHALAPPSMRNIPAEKISRLDASSTISSLAAAHNSKMAAVAHTADSHYAFARRYGYAIDAMIEIRPTATATPRPLRSALRQRFCIAPSTHLFAINIKPVSAALGSVCDAQTICRY